MAESFEEIIFRRKKEYLAAGVGDLHSYFCFHFLQIPVRIKGEVLEDDGNLLGEDVVIVPSYCSYINRSFDVFESLVYGLVEHYPIFICKDESVTKLHFYINCAID